jgi:hypothetical protein
VYSGDVYFFTVLAVCVRVAAGARNVVRVCVGLTILC